MNLPTFQILLAPSVQASQDFPHIPEISILKPHELRGEILDIMRSNPGRVDLLIFANPKEIRNLNELFPSRRTRRLRFAFVLFTHRDGEIGDFETLEEILDLRTGKISESELRFILAKAQTFFKDKDQEKLQDWINRDSDTDLQALITIGKALAYERDPDNLLRSILFLSKKITGADAGSIFITEEGPEGLNLRFKHSHTFSKDLAYEEFTLPANDNSIAGYVARHSTVLNIPDVYHLALDTPYGFNKSFDATNGYRTKSMIAVPLVSPGGKVLGVLQLINCKEAFHHLAEFSGNEAYEIILETPVDFDTKVVPFEPRYEALLEAVAGQAAIAMENNRLFLQIERQFEAFVEASVRAIEARDPATAGHSFRVAKTSELLALAIDASEDEVWSEVHFSQKEIKQLYFACVLHDFGKVYIDYNLFSKAKKLMPEDLQALYLRWDLLHRSLELENPADLTGKLQTLETLKARVKAQAEPSARVADPILEVESILKEALPLRSTFPDGRPLIFLAPEEAENLKIARGSLNKTERKIIESHVEHSYNFVKNIPWPQEFSRIPEFTRMHHEMLDGSGYPLGLQGAQIPIEARIMTLADVFDALSAADRPYKKALPIDQVLVILREEAKAGKLDQNLLDLFIRQEIYKVILQGAG